MSLIDEFGHVFQEMLDANTRVFDWFVAEMRTFLNVSINVELHGFIVLESESCRNTLAEYNVDSIRADRLLRIVRYQYEAGLYTSYMADSKIDTLLFEDSLDDCSYELRGAHCIILVFNYKHMYELAEKVRAPTSRRYVNMPAQMNGIRWWWLRVYVAWSTDTVTGTSCDCVVPGLRVTETSFEVRSEHAKLIALFLEQPIEDRKKPHLLDR